MWLNQTIFPFYRQGFISLLSSRIQDSLFLTGGADSFYPSLNHDLKNVEGYNPLRNKFWFNKGLLWQGGVLAHALRKEVLVTEFNLRTISTIILLNKRRAAGLPTVFWGHTRGRRDRGIPRILRKYLLYRADGFICYTHTDKKSLSLECPRLKTWVAPNAICYESDCVAAAWDNRRTDVIYSGRLVEEKKVKLLLAAFGKAHASGTIGENVRCHIIGAGPTMKQLKDYASSLGVLNRCIFYGEIKDEFKIKTIYSKCFLSISPGYVGLSVIQSFAAGVPMAIAREEHHSPEIEACRDGFNSVFFESDSAEDLARVLGDAYMDRDMWGTRASAIAKDVRDRYTFERMADCFVAVNKFFRGSEEASVPKKTQRAVVFWEYFQNYHSARVRALLSACETSGVLLLPISLTRGSGDAHKSEVPPELFGKYKIISDNIIKRPINDIKIVYKLIKYLAETRPDVVFTPGYVGAVNLSVISWCTLFRIRLVLMFDSQERDLPRTRIREWLKSRIVKLYSSYFCSGTKSRDYVTKLGAPSSKVELGYDCIDNDLFASIADNALRAEASLRALHRLPSQYLIAVGRFIEKKNFAGLIRAYAAYLECTSSTRRLLIVGAGPLEEEIRGLISVYKLVDHVELRNYMPSESVGLYMALSDALIVPSSKEEQWGLVINEGLAVGVPVLASEVCGAAPDLIVNGENGMCFNPADKDEFQDALLSVDAFVRKRNEVRTAARLSVDRFSIRQHVGSFLRLCEFTR